MNNQELPETIRLHRWMVNHASTIQVFNHKPIKDEKGFFIGGIYYSKAILMSASENIPFGQPYKVTITIKPNAQ